MLIQSQAKLFILAKYLVVLVGLTSDLLILTNYNFVLKNVCSWDIVTSTKVFNDLTYL
jgi:hypothetical protein